jgi:sigma-B regulation protein RsbU (phosphoserine phosphatase)
MPASAQVPAGGRLLLYTDGLLDAQNARGEFFGQEQILDLVRSQIENPVEEIRDTLAAAVYAFSGGEPQVDDITLMVVGRDR